MSRPLTRADADRLLLRGAHDELHDAHALVALMREAQEAITETEIDSESLSSPYARQLRLLVLAESKLRLALVAMGQAL